MSSHDNEDLIDYEDEHDVVPSGGATATNGTSASGAGAGADGEGDKDKKNFSGIHSTGFRYARTFSSTLTLFSHLFHVFFSFRDFLLKPELLRAISDLGFEHPSEGEPPV